MVRVLATFLTKSRCSSRAAESGTHERSARWLLLPGVLAIASV
jgi:hypothetical protein